MATGIFFGSIIFILYAYLGYPFLLMLVSMFRNRPVNKATITPRASFVITAHNEEKRLRHKIENTLLQTYPREALEIVVASDCSTDATDGIDRSFAPQDVRLIRAPVGRGKEAVQKLAHESLDPEHMVPVL